MSYLIFESDVPIFKKDLGWITKSYRSRFRKLKSFRTKKELIAYTSERACDWITLARGPQRFYGMPKIRYEICLEILNRGKIPIYIKYYKYYEETTFEKNVKLFMERKGGILVHEGENWLCNK